MKARALLHGRINASFEDTQAVAPPVLGHRVILDYSARLDGRASRDVVAALLQEVPAQASALPRAMVDAA